MFDKILNMLEAIPKKASYHDRLKSINEFFVKYDLYKDMWGPQPNTPMSIVWAISTDHPEIFYQQLGSIMQFEGIFHPDDELILVPDNNRKENVVASHQMMPKTLKTKTIITRRPFPGDGAAFNWDIGVDYASHDRVFFLRDLNLFFQPWEMFRAARQVNVEYTLHNLSTVLGPVWSRYADKWLYLVHPRFAPNPFLFAFILSKKNYMTMNGFDPMLGRGFDHTGELDFLLRWNMYGYSYEMSEETHIFHPGMTANSQEELNEMQFQSSINRRYFFDRYGEDFINSLQPPYKINMNMIEANHALTYSPLSEVVLDDSAFAQYEEVKDAFSFNKWSKDLLIQEIVE